MRTRILTPLAALALLAACGDADGAAPATPEGPAASSTTIAVADGAMGPMLVDGEGRTLYLFTVDAPGVSTCEGGCLEAWPPLLTDGEPATEGGADAALVDTLVRSNGTVQVTYAGWPLYFFAADASPGDVNGQGVNDVWFVVGPDGTMLAEDATEETPAGDGMGSSPVDEYGY